MVQIRVPQMNRKKKEGVLQSGKESKMHSKNTSRREEVTKRGEAEMSTINECLS
jgi:hypothetical protein